ncbi:MULTISPECIES: RagB/SusD family nutrient uptake outer membrane protein [Bacteroidota]|uniref:RagB/SusD family nutrient uptake outer membrane protein n=1 Tax=Bacteroidota TaxID=976 RepID=UPI001CBBFB26|nr:MULTISPECIES: RagB/SusD family nutrient uptake outer membrane protein [Bacteroidota]MBZ4190749.1 RagB/SusD family nutrient uptake outer membrane protein [Niabella beijingensis]UMQ40859.1 RagB/SusD family nutrient uptake outer membrane protein [Chryseobacterium sp. Y16C]
MTRYIFILLFFIITLTGCEKYLDVKPDKALVVPATVADLRALLNNTERMNSWYPSLQDAATDNQFVQTINWNTFVSLTAKNIYIFNDDVFNDSEVNEWSMMYSTIYYCNLILEQLEKIAPVPAEKSQIEGETLFFRSFAFYNVAQLWAKPYDKNTSHTDLGIPLRLKPDINEKSKRSTVEETYSKIIADLNRAASVLSVKGDYKTTPTKQAAYALLARIYLSMEDYEKALSYADSCLSYSNSLLDYNTLTMGSATSFPIPRFNVEVIFHANDQGRQVMNITNGRIDNELYNSYAANDLRKTAFFRSRAGYYSFRGNYDGNSGMWFAGISTNEIYLIKAECEARAGHIATALQTINELLKNRYNSTFVPFSSDNDEAVLRFVLDERRKELIWRGLRWSDLRRLNKDSRFAKTITRDIDGKIYTLEPNSPKYVLPIPNSVILNNGMQQNER